ncbi:MAG: hypothetical protein OXF64_04010 [bacterium]|nr:hypothetical protein [bacterium]MCY4194584.1 hypothetical protein [bacterium]MCY4272295.1 hypothetical protein [bacterium]
MRTTITIDDEVYEEARRIAFESRRTLGETINELIADGLKLASPPSKPRQLGRLRGTITIADDFDDIPVEVRDSINDPL